MKTLVRPCLALLCCLFVLGSGVARAAETPGNSGVKSTTGPQRNSQMFAEIPSATIDAAVATEKPAPVRKNGSVMETNPLLMPYGSNRKKNVKGLVVDPGFGTVAMQLLGLAVRTV